MDAKVNGVAIEIVQTDIYSVQVEGLVYATDSNLSINEIRRRRKNFAVSIFFVDFFFGILYVLLIF